MFKYFGLPVFLLALAAVFFAVFPAADLRAQSPEYTVTVLGSLGGNGSVAYGVNDSGGIAGTSYTASQAAEYAVTWSGTTPTKLGAITGPTESYTADAISSSGLTVGYGQQTQNSEIFNALEWTGTTPTVLGSLGGFMNQAKAVNSSGEIVGFVGGVGRTAAAYAAEWTGTTPTILGDFGHAYSEALAINDSGEVVGFSPATSTSGADAVYWSGTTPTLLQTVAGPGNTSESEALGINDSGEIVGTSRGDAVEWTGTTVTVLSAAVGGSDAYATAINSLGTVVGYSGELGGTFTGFIYTGGTTYNINSLLAPGSSVDISYLYGINDSGVIVGAGSLNGQQYAVELNPVAVPEPSDIWLLSGGFAIGAGLVVRKRRWSAGQLRA